MIAMGPRQILVFTLSILGLIVFTLGDAGPLSSSSTNFISVVLFLVFVLSASTAFRHRDLVLIAFVFFVFALASSLLPNRSELPRLLLIVIVCIVIGQVLLKKDEQLAILACTLGLTAFLIAVVRALFVLEPGLWFSVELLSQRVSHSIGRVTSQPLLLSIVASGFFISLNFVVFGVLAFFLSTRRRVAEISLYAVGILIANGIFMSLLHPAWKLFRGMFPEIHPMNLLWSLVFLDAIPLYFFLRKRVFSSVFLNIIPTAWKGVVLSSGSFVLGVILMSPSRPTMKDSKETVLIYNRGYFNWEKPVFGKYGLQSGGMFGMLPSYLRAFGYDVRTDSSMNSSSLEKVRVVVVINLNSSMLPTEKKMLQDFVYDGGSLLVMGDHTGLGGIMEPLNDLIDFVKIRFKFDSGHYLRKDWMDAFQFPPHRVLQNVRDEVDVGISVGASLDLSPVEARPVLVAKYGFSDWGNPLNSENAYLGDRAYNPGELLGNIVLVAEAQHGKGKVLVFGDTSSFQNGTLTYSFTFVRNVFDYLSSRDVGWAYGIRRVASLCFLVLGLLFLFVFAKPLVQPSSVLWVSILLAISNLLFSPEAIPETGRLSIGSPMAYIDASHLNRFSQYGDDGIWALSHNLMRNEYLPFVHRRFSPEALKQSKLAFFISPVKDLASNQIEELSRFVHEGGTAVWSVGYEEKETSAAVLQHFGFELDNTPLGPVPIKETSAGIQFHKAWPIIVGNPETADTISTGWSYPVIVSRRIGKGTLVLISDSGFLLSENLESRQAYIEANVLFLRKFLTNVREN